MQNAKLAKWDILCPPGTCLYECVCVYLVGQDAVQEEFPKENMKTLALLKHQK